MVNEEARGAGTPDPAAPVGPALPTGELPPGYIWAYQSVAPPRPSWKPPRWLIVVTVVWAVALLVSGVIYARDGKPSVRGQTTIVGAEPVVNRAVVTVAAAAGAGPVAAIGGFTKIGDCTITPVRSGVDYQRTIMFYAAPGSESAVLKTIASGLPRSYAAKSGPGAILDLYADAGDYVAITGAVPAPGEIEIRAATGCREAGGAIAEPPAPAIGSPGMAPVRAVLAALGVVATSTSQAEINCPGGTGTMRTVAAHAPSGQVPGPLGSTLASLAAAPALASPNVFAYRSGTTDVVATQDSSGLTVAATTRCQ